MDELIPACNPTVGLTAMLALFRLFMARPEPSLFFCGFRVRASAWLATIAPTYSDSYFQLQLLSKVNKNLLF